MKFAKWHGIGNDYIIVEQSELPLQDDGTPGFDDLDVRLLCDRNFGIGSDGILVLGPSDVADARMLIHNPDGSMAEMCGNGIRMAARYLVAHGLVDGPESAIETAGGIMRPRVNDDGTVRVDMGTARVEPVEEVFVDGHGTFTGRAVSMGNPHFVIAADPDAVGLERVGPLLEHHGRFAPARTNVEFVEVLGPSQARMRVWERGVGETLACGTGACAVGVASVLDHGCTSPLLVHLSGGDLVIEVDRASLHVFMTGAASESFAGDVRLDDIRAAAPAGRFGAPLTA